MTTHPRRNRGPYTAIIGGTSWSQGPTGEFDTVRACRAWAEEYGTTADHCKLLDRHGNCVAEHRRDPSGDGTRWFRATV
jgi:hypothetical protein